jgi:hypothetical protein
MLVAGGPPMIELTIVALALLSCIGLRHCYHRLFQSSALARRIDQFSSSLLARRIGQFIRYALVAALAAVLIGGFTVPCIVWDGWPEVMVHFDITGEPPAVVGCRPLGSREHAGSLASHAREPDHLPIKEMFGHYPAALADPFDGAPIKVRIGTSGRQSAFGCELSRGQERAILVGAEWRDGRRTWKVVDAPDLQQSREVIVSLP